MYADPTHNERECPNMVEVLVPEIGFDETLELIRLFHVKLKIERRSGRGRRWNDRDYVRWCFADRNHAKAFCAMFGGALIEPAT